MKNYSRNYIRIYFWQSLSIILGFISLFIVTPFLSSDPVTFGIYAICISASIFLSYADLGFLAAGQKFAAEEYAKNNLDSERRIIGFSGFVLLVFIILFSAIFIIISINPKVLISDLKSNDFYIARSLLIILALSTPAVVLQRVSQMIYSVRIEDYIIQRIRIVGNIIKILSVFYFFSGERYHIIGYYAFMQLTNLFVAVSAIIIANNRYNYGLKAFFKSFKFDKEIFKKTKDLASNSIFLALSWILYYELDNFVIGKILNAEKVAIYAIGLTLMSFLRTILGTIFSPFASRFNHYVGLNDQEGLKKSFTQVVSFSFPIVTFAILTIVLLMNSLVLCWVGNEYKESVILSQLLISCNLFAFISYPCGLLLAAQLRLKEMYIVGILLPLVYWLGIISTFNFIGLLAFSLFKLVSFLIASVYYFKLILEYLDITILAFFKKYITSSLPSFLLLILCILLLRDHLPSNKSTSGLFIVLMTGIIVGSFFLAIAYIMKPDFRYLILKFRKKMSDRMRNRMGV